MPEKKIFDPFDGELDDIEVTQEDLEGAVFPPLSDDLRDEPSEIEQRRYAKKAAEFLKGDA